MRLFFPSLCVMMLGMVGCCSAPSSPPSELTKPIGQMTLSDTAGLDTYETAVTRLLDHMDDAITVLASVDSADSSTHAAGLIKEATPRFIKMRRAMTDTEPDREISAAGMILSYGGRYLRTTNGIDREMRRIKGLGPDVHEPVKSAMLTLKEGLRQAGLPAEP